MSKLPYENIFVEVDMANDIPLASSDNAFFNPWADLQKN